MTVFTGEPLLLRDPHPLWYCSRCPVILPGSVGVREHETTHKGDRAAQEDAGRPNPPIRTSVLPNGITGAQNAVQQFEGET